MGLPEQMTSLNQILSIFGSRYTSFMDENKQRVTYHLLNVTAKKHILCFTIHSMASRETEVGEGRRVEKDI